MSDIQNLTIDLDLKENLLVTAICKQLDNLNLIFNIWNDGQTVDLSNYKCRLKALKSDQVPLVQNTEIIINNNVVMIKADEQLTTTSGNVKTEVQLIDKTTGDKKSSFDLNLKVSASVLEVDRTISKATITLLEELDNKLDEIEDIGDILDEAKTVKSDLKANITTGTTLDTELKEDIKNANNSKSALDTSKTNADNSKSALDTSTTNADTKKQEVEATTANAETKKQEVIAEVKVADAKIAKLESFGDASTLLQEVTDMKKEIETARGTEGNLYSRLDKFSTSLSECAKKIDVIPIIDLKGQTIATHSIVETGIYKNAMWTDYPSSLVDGQGELIVLKHSDGWVYHKFNSPGQGNYERKMINKVWSKWTEIATSDTIERKRWNTCRIEKKQLPRNLRSCF